jgi:hypothetical protein
MQSQASASVGRVRHKVRGTGLGSVLEGEVRKLLSTWHRRYGPEAERWGPGLGLCSCGQSRTEWEGGSLSLVLKHLSLLLGVEHGREGSSVSGLEGALEQGTGLGQQNTKGSATSCIRMGCAQWEDHRLTYLQKLPLPPLNFQKHRLRINNFLRITSMFK